MENKAERNNSGNEEEKQAVLPESLPVINTPPAPKGKIRGFFERYFRGAKPQVPEGEQLKNEFTKTGE